MRAGKEDGVRTLEQHSGRRGPGGFTLIELLVVVSVIAILISVLLPALNAARSAAQKIAGASLHRQMGVAQAAYSTENDDQYAGPSSSGAKYYAVRLNPFQRLSDQLYGNTSSTTPTSTYDWISPTFGNELRFSSNRAERTADIFNNLACPSSQRLNDTVFGLAGVPDADDFERVLQSEGFTQISFLSPFAFHTTASSSRQRVPGAPSIGGRPQLLPGWNFAGPVQLPSRFRPRYSSIKQPSDKVLITDGCRYLTSSGVLDFDADARPNFFGSFTTNGPVLADAATAFRRIPGSGKSEDSWLLSVRHAGNTQINTTRFDGSVQTITTDTLFADPHPWYPSGSTWNGSGATPEAIEYMRGGRNLIN